VSATLWQSGISYPLYHRRLWRWQLLLYISEIDYCPDSYSSMIKSFWVSPYLAMFISFPFSLSAGFSDGGSHRIKRAGVIELRSFSSSASGNICF
jgi:hypothetical protein